MEEEAIFLTNFASKVSFPSINGGGIIGTNKVVQEQARKNENQTNISGVFAAGGCAV